jgi:hypothetical protein
LPQRRYGALSRRGVAARVSCEHLIEAKEIEMLALLLLLLLLVVVFGGLGMFVAKVFFIGIAAVLIIGLLAGGGLARRA